MYDLEEVKAPVLVIFNYYGMERLIHYLNYGTRVTFHDPVILFREQEWATRARDFAQLEWLVRERGESLSFFFPDVLLFIHFILFRYPIFRSPLDFIRKDAANGDGLPKWRFIQEVPWEKRPNPDGKVESIPSLSITFCDSCAPSPSDVDAPKITLS